MNDVRTRTERFRALHESAEPLRLVNVWDAVSARVAEHAGAPALGTSSFAIAIAHGHLDGEQIPWPVVLDVVAEIVHRVEVPVTVDIESGRGPRPDAVATTVADVVDVGGVGINLEDSDPRRPGALFAIDEQCARINAARTAGDVGGVRLFLNARCDVWFGAHLSPEARLAEARRRARSYVDAGADGLFLPGLVDVDDLRTMSDAVDVPVNVMLWPGLPSVTDLRDAGIRRISQGGASFLEALGSLEQTTNRYLTTPAPATLAPDAPVPAIHLVEPLTTH